MNNDQMAGKKKLSIAYLLLFTTWIFGGHRVYLGKERGVPFYILSYGVLIYLFGNEGLTLLLLYEASSIHEMTMNANGIYLKESKIDQERSFMNRMVEINMKMSRSQKDINQFIYYGEYLLEMAAEQSDHFNPDDRDNDNFISILETEETQEIKNYKIYREAQNVVVKKIRKIVKISARLRSIFISFCSYEYRNNLLDKKETLVDELSEFVIEQNTILEDLVKQEGTKTDEV